MEIHAFSQTDISGTWYVNGRHDLTRTIFQNENKIILYAGNLTSTGNFTNDKTINATDWKKIANLVEGNSALIWDNQMWTREKFTSFPAISGEWFLYGNPNESYSITQDNIYFSISSKDGQTSGYFIDNHKVTVPKWNNVFAHLSADGTTLNWENQKWIKKVIANQESTSGKKLSRLDLSTLYVASQTLGYVWPGMDIHTPVFNKNEIHTIDKQLSQAEKYFQNISWLAFEYQSLNQLRQKLSVSPTVNIADEINTVVRDLLHMLQNMPSNKEQSLHPSALFTAGIHLGAAQRTVYNSTGYNATLAVENQALITNHLAAVGMALNPYKDCISTFDFDMLDKQTLNKMNTMEAYTYILDIGTKLLWAVTLSDCGYQILPANTLAAVKSECDEKCKRFCLLQGKSDGKFNYKAECFKGESMEESKLTCDCW